MLDQEDEGTRIGVWVALGVVFFVLAGVLGGVVLRQMSDKHGRTAAPSAPAVAAAPAAAEPEMIDLPLSGELMGKLYFDSGVAALPAEALALVAQAAKTLADNPARKLLISGFHDATGHAANNAELAKQRALAVRAAALAAGADRNRVLLRKPESTTGDGSLQEARRVELRLVD
jgi:outer membrane protein OmpA-like peptidoglycan-associated protein